MPSNSIPYDLAPGQTYDPGYSRVPVGTTINGATRQPDSAYSYNINPTPQAGYGASGGVPGAIGLPNPYQDLQRHLTNLGPLNNQAGADILGNLNGQLSPETMARIQDASAAFGISSGMPGSGLARSRTARDLGLATQDLQARGVQQYNQTIPTISGTQTVSPGLQSEIASRNATFAAAPNPAAATSHAESLFQQYLDSMGRGNGGRGGGGVGAPGAPVSSAFGPAGGANSYVRQPWASDRPNGPGITGPQGGGSPPSQPWYGNRFNYSSPGDGSGIPGYNDIPANMYDPNFGNPGSMDAGIGADLWDSTGSNYYGGAQSGSPDWANGNTQWGGAPGSLGDETGQELWDMAGGGY